jgi:hypothetical protein
MTESIKFPSASNTSKLSACPTTKVPQASDWIYQDFFNSMLNNSSHEYRQPIHQIPNLILNEKFSYNNAKEEYMPYQHYLSETTFSEALHVVVEPQHHTWDNTIDYHVCPTSSSSSLTTTDDLLPDLDEEEEDEEDDSVVDDQVAPSSSDFAHYTAAPVLIESTISSCTTSTEDAMSFRKDNGIIAEESIITIEVVQQNTINNQSLIKKRKSTSSFSSLKSFMNVFNTLSHKKSKLDHPSFTTTTSVTSTPIVNTSKTKSMSNSLSKKFLKYFKRRS